MLGMALIAVSIGIPFIHHLQSTKQEELTRLQSKALAQETTIGLLKSEAEQLRSENERLSSLLRRSTILSTAAATAAISHPLPRNNRLTEQMINAADAALSRMHENRWCDWAKGGKAWRRDELCTTGSDDANYQTKKFGTVQGNIFLVDANGRGTGSIPAETCETHRPLVSQVSTVHDRFEKVMVNGRVLTFDDIVTGYERIFETKSLYSATTFLGVALQQDPNDAFVIQEMLWRVQPDLVIELGTSGGGSAHFFAHIMQQYNKDAKVLTMDPSVLKLTSKQPLVNWNFRDIRAFCPHCVAANETDLWKSGAIHFVRAYPNSSKALAIAETFARDAERVVVIEDSSHVYDVVRSNVEAYGRFVTPGSYMLVQDTRGGRWAPERAIGDFLRGPNGAGFEVDRRWEYLVFSQHTGGWLRKRAPS